MNRLGIPVTLTLFTCTTHQQHTRGGADCGVAIIIVVDVHIDLGERRRGTGHGE